MPRSPRVFLEGGIYHVYNRVTRGELVFGEDNEALFLLETMRKVRDRDGFIVLAWCIMGNHDHLAVRCTSVPLWRSMANIHTKVSNSYSARYRVCGPFWQGRNKAKLIETTEYFRHRRKQVQARIEFATLAASRYGIRSTEIAESIQ